MEVNSVSGFVNTWCISQGWSCPVPQYGYIWPQKE